jgi:hypothetical protein
MGIASYEIVGSGGSWRVKHDGDAIGRACYERQKKHANNTLPYPYSPLRLLSAECPPASTICIDGG